MKVIQYTVYFSGFTAFCSFCNDAIFFLLSLPRTHARTHTTVRPGERYRNVGNEIQRHAQSNGFSVVRTYCGHGINQ